MSQLRLKAPLVTVIVPTFDHVRTLEYSVPTALAQTVDSLEVIVIGDGAPDETRHVVEALAAGDSRVRYVAYPKGERTGEPHRHHVLTNIARGEYVFYLSDDDLWMPEHVETMLDLMRSTDANFVCCQPTWLLPGDEADQRGVVDLSLEFFRTELLASRNRVSLSCAAHSMELYQSLPHGWRTTPRGTPTDLYMWQQLLDHPTCRAASTPWTTVIGLPDVRRASQSAQERCAELATWYPTTDPEVRRRFLAVAQAADNGLLAHAHMEAVHTPLAEGYSRLAETHAELAKAHAQLVDAHREVITVLDGLVGEREVLLQVRDVAADRERELRAIYASRAWRTAEGLRRLLGRGKPA